MKTIKLSYDGYLTEKKLVQLFEDLEKQTNLIKIETNVKIEKYRGDIVINDYWLVEFDGYRHYSQSSVFTRDNNKDNIWEIIFNRKFIRIPYFVQLNTEAFNFYFKELIETFELNIEIDCNYPQGFIDKKALLPADFCSVGERKFLNDLCRMPISIYNQIWNSLIDLLEIKQAEEIFSLNLRETLGLEKMFNYLSKTYSDAFDLYNCFYKIKPGNKKITNKKKTKSKNKKK